MSLSKLHDWSNTWLLSLNAQKWKVVSYTYIHTYFMCHKRSIVEYYGRHADKNYKYMIQQDWITELHREDHIKDQGVIFDENWTLACILPKELIKAIACYG